ncbi:unnamed protein product [Diplocarpon coronariae]
MTKGQVQMNRGSICTVQVQGAAGTQDLETTASYRPVQKRQKAIHRPATAAALSHGGMYCFFLASPASRVDRKTKKRPRARADAARSQVGGSVMSTAALPSGTTVPNPEQPGSWVWPTYYCAVREHAPKPRSLGFRFQLQLFAPAPAQLCTTAYSKIPDEGFAAPRDPHCTKVPQFQSSSDLLAALASSGSGGTVPKVGQSEHYGTRSRDVSRETSRLPTLHRTQWRPSPSAQPSSAALRRCDSYACPTLQAASSGRTSHLGEIHHPQLSGRNVAAGASLSLMSPALATGPSGCALGGKPGATSRPRRSQRGSQICFGSHWICGPCEVWWMKRMAWRASRSDAFETCGISVAQARLPLGTAASGPPQLPEAAIMRSETSCLTAVAAARLQHLHGVIVCKPHSQHNRGVKEFVAFSLGTGTCPGV